MLTLRPTQVEALSKTSDAYTRVRKVLLNAHTAFGKSTLTGTMIRSSKKTVLYLCHRDVLLDRVSADLTEQGIPHGVIEGSRGALPNTYRVHIGMAQTIARRLHELPPFQWIISDEAHLAMSKTWASVLQHYSSAWHLGMSGTPCRLDGKGLGELYDEIIYGPSIKDSTDRGYLARCRAFAPPVEAHDADKLSLSAQSEKLNTPTITGSAIEEMRKRGADRQFMAFTCDRKHAEDVALSFRNAGISAVAVDSTMSDRSERIRDFEAQRVQGIINVELLTTGYDYKPVSLGIFLRHTDSLALYLQMCGRFVRTYPGKEDWLMHDHVGLLATHGMPDADREWTLDGRAKRDATPAIRQCGQCYAVFAPSPQCPSCGYTIPVASKPRKIVQVSGELEEVTDAAASKDRQVQVKAALKNAVTLRDFNEVAKQFGYKAGWAFKMHEIYGKNRRRAA